MIRADLHIHTCFSPDSQNRLEDIIKKCLEIGINCLAITDHNTIEGALRMKEIAPFPIIVGEEILTTKGEIIGFFLKEKIPKFLTPEETITRIKLQGGLVCIPHPFDGVRAASALETSVLKRLAPHIDIIEVFNSRVILERDIKRAFKFAEEGGFLKSAGSDAHNLFEIGNAYVEMDEFDDVESFKEALRRGEIKGRRMKFLERMRAFYEGIKRRCE